MTDTVASAAHVSDAISAGTEQLIGRGHTARCLCCYLPLMWLLLSVAGQVVIEDIVAPEVNLVCIVCGPAAPSHFRLPGCPMQPIEAYTCTPSLATLP